MVGAGGPPGLDLGSFGTSVGPQQITLKGLAHLWTFVELARDVSPMGSDLALRLDAAIRLVEWYTDHHREPDAILVSRETKRILVEFEEDKDSYHGIEIVIADIPDFTFFYGEKVK